MEKEICLEEAQYFLMGSERKESGSKIQWFREGKLVAETDDEKKTLRVDIDNRSESFDEISGLMKLGIDKSVKFVASEVEISQPRV